jgi:glycosyltransferase involved in cell wall biosynthesis
VIEFLFWALLVSILVDGIKLLVESLAQSNPVSYGGDHRLVTVIIPARNEEKTIVRTLASVAKIMPLANIIVVDDDSSDRTAKILGLNSPPIRMIHVSHKGKVNAIHAALRYVYTPYVMLLDADIELSDNFVIPTDALRDGYATAVAFNVVPNSERDSWTGRVLYNLQRHEYAKSMQIGRKFNSVTKSVHCISGAAGLFKTERLVELSKSHTTIFPGEDLERTLLELASRGQVIFANHIVRTDVPDTITALTRQRVLGWWPGLWRNIWLFLKIIMHRRVPFRLRYEVLYELFSLFTDPLKIISLFGLIYTGAWLLLGAVYVIYLALEILVVRQLRKMAGRYMEMPVLVTLLFPLYSALQMLYRGFAFGVFVWKKVFTNDWQKAADERTDDRKSVKSMRTRKVAAATLLLALAVSLAVGQKKTDWTVGYSYSRAIDQPMDRSFNNHDFLVAYKGIYSEVSTTPYNQVNLGMYYQNWWGDVRYRWDSEDIQAKVQYEYWFGSIVPRVMGGSFIQTAESHAFPIGGLGVSWYFNDLSSVNLDLIKEWGRVFGTTYVASVRLRYPEGGFWGTVGGTITNFGDPGAFGQIGYGPVYIHGDYYKHFDYSDFDRGSFGVGVLVRF